MNKGNWIRSAGSPGMLLRITTLIILLTAWWSTISPIYGQTVYTPVRYYTFNGTNPLADSTGNFNLNTTTYNSQYSIGTGGQTGKFMTLINNTNLIDGGALPLTNAVTVEFLLKPGYDFQTTKLLQRGDGAFSVRMEYATITFSTSHRNSSGSTVNDDLVVQLDGIGRKSYGYYVDGGWHHMVFRFNAATGEKSIWVDGQNPAGFSKTIATGSFNNSGNTNFYLNHSIRYVKYYGSIDELAIYNTAIPDKLIYKHYLGVQSGQSYNYTDNYSGTVPSPSPVTGSIDPMEFAPGHPSVNISATDQILSFPVPRFKPGHSLHPNVPLYGVEYLGGLLQSGVSYTQALNIAKIQQVELINHFNQSILASSNSHEFAYGSDTTKFTGWFVKYANQNPSKHASVFTFWPQITPSSIGRPSNQAYAMCDCLPSSNYLKNSSGQFLTTSGAVTTTDKTLSPAAPLDSIRIDGLTQRYYLDQLTRQMTRPINLLFENGELIPFINSSAVLSMDPTVLNDKNASGLDWYTYEGRRAKEKVIAYRDQFMNLPALANTKFAYFQVDGQSTWRFKYSEMRQTHTMMNNQYYPTGDIYMRFPYNWRTWSSAWHGWQWVAESRREELAVGDKLFSPPVAAGWDVDETKNIRPAQWLGMLKAISMSGAEFFYPSFFNLQAPYADPKNWAWQTVMPAYSQAISSRYEDLLRNGFLMEGDVPNDYINPAWNAYSFKSGDLRKLVVIRKHNTASKYAFYGTLQPNSNFAGNAENAGIAEITLDGQNVKFMVRRQGSTYIYDKTNSVSPVFYQLDEWHESTHPSYWNKDFIIEGELFDNTNTGLAIKTTVPVNTPAGDYTNFTSFVSFASATEAVYNFTPRSNTVQRQFVWVRARSRDGSSTGFNVSINNGATQTIDCIRDTNWVWYRFSTSGVALSFSGINPGVNQALRLAALNGKLEIDKIHITASTTAIYSGPSNLCSTAQATITASGPTTFCQGGSVTLTASSGSAFLWSNGSTSQSVSVSSSGTYTVTVTSNGTASVSSPVTVTVSSLPTATISASGPTTFCAGGTVTLTASSGSSYLWSPGNQTTQSITVNSSGTYSVRVTNSSGCSKISSGTTVTVNALPTATISASGPTSFCSGGSVTLTASAGSSYLWSPGNQTSQSITVSTAGTYSVRVTNSSGCSSVSTGTTVLVNSIPTATISAGGPTTFCAGGSVTLTASSGSSYLWSPGNQTTQSITVNSSGTYSVRVTNSSGCSKVSSGTTVTVNSLPSATITASGSLNLSQGQSVTLTASAGSSYLWSPGGQTTSSITVSTAGSYTVRVTNTNGCSSVSSPANVTVSGSAVPATITASGSTSFCQGGNVTLTANNGTSYLWSTGATSQSILVSNSGTYTVTVTNNGIPSVSPSTSVTVWSLPTASITASGTTSLCTGQSVTLTASSGSSYLWNPGNQTTQSITVSTAGSYSVRVTNSQGCSATSPATSVTVSSCTTCDMPTGLVTTGVFSNSATLKWNNPGTGQTQFQVRLRNMSTGYQYLTGQVPATTTSIGVGANSSTTYRWWVRSWCGTVRSSYAGYLTFTTPAPRVATINPLDEDFFEPLYQDTDDQFEESGTAEFISRENIQIYPNPANSETTVMLWSDSEDKMEMSVMDFNGKVVFTEQFNPVEGINLRSIDTSPFKRGVYIVRIIGKGKTEMKQLVLQ